MTGRMAKIMIELWEQSPSDTIAYPPKRFTFPEKGHSARGIVVSKLLDWLLNHNITTPGKLIVHGFTYDIKKHGAERMIEVVGLDNTVYLKKRDYVSKGKEVK